MSTTNPYYDPNRSAGEEVSSTSEGRHVLLEESELVHVDLGGGLVRKGQPVSFGLGWFGTGVGIALQTATAVTDHIPVDTEGIWRLDVTNEFEVVVGQVLFITNAGVVVDWPIDMECHIMGYAMQPIAEAGTSTIAVKVHWMDTGIWWFMFWWWFQEFPK